MVRLETLLHFYRKRLRVHAVQELLAGTAIVVSVALVLTYQAVNSGVGAAGRQNLRALTGDATLALVARDGRGFDARLRARVAALPGVAHASALLEQGASVAYGGRRVPIHLLGADARLSSLHPLATQRIDLGRLQPGIVLSASVARRLALVRTGRPSGLPQLRLIVRGRARAVPVSAVLDRGMLGPLSDAALGVAPLSYAQRLAHLPQRVTRVLVAPAAGQQTFVRAELERVGAGKLTVLSRDEELRSLTLATAAIDRGTTLLTAIGALVALLFAFTAMLPTLPDRRRFVAALRMTGCPRSYVVQILAFQAIVLGAIASAVGVLVGAALAHGTDHDLTGYLDFAFVLGSHHALSWQVLATTFAGGVLASCLASALPLLDLHAGRAPVAVFARLREPGRTVNVVVLLLALCGLALLATAGAVLLLESSVTIVGMVVSAVAIMLAVFAAIRRLSRRWRPSSLVLALRALRATSPLALGLVVAGAVAVFAAVGMLGWHQSLLNGMYADFRGYFGTADVWIAQPGDDLAVQSFDAHGLARRVAAVDGVRDVRSLRSSLLDVGGRRVWVIARPDGDRPLVPTGQVAAGDVRMLAPRVQAGGWVAVSQQVADARGAGLGGEIRLPTPTGSRTYRVAAITTNLGWGPGAVVMSARSYRRAWGSDDVSALEVDLAPGTDADRAVAAIRHALGVEAAGLQVETAHARVGRATAVARSGLAWSERAARLLLIAAALSLAAAIGAGTWQRRAAFGQLRLMGWRSLRLWYALLWETALVLGTGCLVGAAAGLYGQYLGNRWLRQAIDYPTVQAFAPGKVVSTCLLVFALALAGTAVAGAFMSRTPPRTGRTPPA
jgi:putative ABC transport system permease protein